MTLCGSTVLFRKMRNDCCCDGLGRWYFPVPRKDGGSATSRPPRAEHLRSHRTVRVCASRCETEKRVTSCRMETGRPWQTECWRWRPIHHSWNVWDAQRARSRKDCHGTPPRGGPSNICTGPLPHTKENECMRVTITARHTEIDDELRAHARELVEKVAKLARRPHHAQVTFSED